MPALHNSLGFDKRNSSQLNHFIIKLVLVKPFFLVFVWPLRQGRAALLSSIVELLDREQFDVSPAIVFPGSSWSLLRLTLASKVCQRLHFLSVLRNDLPLRILSRTLHSEFNEESSRTVSKFNLETQKIDKPGWRCWRFAFLFIAALHWSILRRAAAKVT